MEPTHEEWDRKRDADRIRRALAEEKREDAFVLFRYSVLTEEEFDGLLKEREEQEKWKEHMKNIERKQIEKALASGKEGEAFVLFRYTEHLTMGEFKELERKWKQTGNND